MELSRKEKFSKINHKSNRKWPKIILGTVFALLIGSTTAFAAKPELADYLYNAIIKYTYHDDIQNELKAEKDNLLSNLHEKVQKIFTDTKTELDQKKSEIIEAKKEDLKKHYDSEIEKITQKKTEAVTQKSTEMTNDAKQITENYKAEITTAIEKELETSNISGNNGNHYGQDK